MHYSTQLQTKTSLICFPQSIIVWKTAANWIVKWIFVFLWLLLIYFCQHLCNFKRQPSFSVGHFLHVDSTNEPRHDKTNKVSVHSAKTQISLGIRPVSSVRSAFFMQTAKTLIRLGRCPGWSESLLGAHSFYWFCHVVPLIVLPDRLACSRVTSLRIFCIKIIQTSKFP